jgi:Uma2 family endonuclease
MATATRASIEEYLSHETPQGFRDELIEGEIVLSPDPKPLHEDICRNLVVQLEKVLAGTEFIVRTRTNALLREDESMPSPDVFIIDRTRWNQAREADSYPEGSPQLPIEVYSPANRPGLLRKKIELYLKNGAWAVWVVYIKSQTVVAHTQSDLVKEYRIEESIPLPGPLSAASIRIEDIFRLQS